MSRRKDNYSAINEIKKMLGTTKKLTLEGFIMPDEDVPYDEDGQSEEFETRQDNADGFQKADKVSGISNIEKELIEIRKIALSVINRLADQTGSESYDTMKRIWSLVDKAIESKNDEDKQNNNHRI